MAIDYVEGINLIGTNAGDIKYRQNSYNLIIFCFTIILMVFGLANLYSASLGTDYFWGQLNKAAIGFVLLILCGWVFPLRKLNEWSTIFYILNVLALMAVFFGGQTVFGSKRWIAIGPIVLQPSEFSKIIVAMVMARYFYINPKREPYDLKDLWKPGAMVMVIFLLVFKQPDLGTAGVCLLVGVTQLAFIRINLRSIAYVAAASCGVAITGWFFALHSYQKLRVLNLFNPERDPSGSGYNSLQSLVAIGSGHMFGKGFMQGTQTQLQFLPARHTDFVFSVFAEEQGFFFSAVIFMMFALLIYLALMIGRQARDTFNSMLAVGIAAFLFLQFFINLAMILGIFPVVGIPLPFFSQGGSSMMVICISLGLLIAINRKNTGVDSKPEFKALVEIE